MSITRESYLIKPKGRLGLISSEETFKAFPEVRSWRGGALLLTLKKQVDVSSTVARKGLCQQLELGRGLQTSDETTHLADSGIAALRNPKKRTQLSCIWNPDPGKLWDNTINDEIIIYRNRKWICYLPPLVAIVTVTSFFQDPTICQALCFAFSNALSFNADTIQSLKIYSLNLSQGHIH